ncbi:MAG: hypothetical protein ORO02_09735 [Bacteroidia bacterium]|nr:hypothetical protein [Bacteroidia bacterium]
MRNLLILCLLSTLTMGCNNLYRSNYTSVTLSKPVAEYLNQQTLTVHNNKPNPTIRKAQVQPPFADTNYRLQYRRLAGNSLILEITDAQGNRRNIAIPQTKLKGYPIATTTTTAPVVIAQILKYEDPYSYYNFGTEVAVGVGVLSALSDALITPLVRLTARNRQFAVPKGFALTNLDQVQTLDTSNPQLYTIAQPINPNITPYLDADWQKHTRVFLATHAGYGLVNQDGHTHYTEKLAPSNWFAAEINLQSSKNLRWGVRYDWTKTPTFFANATTLQVAYVNNQLPNANLLCGVGLGIGLFERIASSNFTETSDLLYNRKLGKDSLRIIENTFVPNRPRYYVPLSAYIQYEALLTNNIRIILGVRMASVKSFTTYNSREFLQTYETIAPGITAERLQTINYPTNNTYNSQNMSFQGHIGLNFLISK